MKKYIFIILILLTSCVVSKKSKIESRIRDRAGVSYRNNPKGHGTVPKNSNYYHKKKKST